MNKAAKTLVIFAALAVTLAAGQATGKKQAHADPRWFPPPQAVQMKNPLADRPEAAAGGAKLFRADCAQCHGREGKGIGNAPDLSSFEVQVQTDGGLFWKITNGNLDRGMPAWSSLPRLERWQLVLYLRQLGR